jgi:hypothetical protein
MPGKTAKSSQSATVWSTRRADSRPHLASGFQGNWKIAAIQPSSGVIGALS